MSITVSPFFVVTEGMSDLQLDNEVQSRAVTGLFEIFENMCEGAISVDRNARIVWINEKYRALLGIPEESDVLGREIEQVIPESLMRRVVDSGQPIPVDIMRFQDQHFVVSRLPLHGDSGKLIGAVGFVLYDSLDYLKPLISKFDRLRDRLNAAEKELASARRTRYSLSNVVGNSPRMVDIRSQVRRIASSDSPVLLLGETGTGKEMLAQSIHALSREPSSPFVAVNVAAVPEGLMEAEFFGVAPGAYTGAATNGRPGKFAVANGGTLFLDEIADMPIHLQVKLLRALEENTIEPVGSNDLRRIDVRIIAATSHDIEAKVEAGQFRKDLFYRLNVLQVNIPPLRDRLQDLPQLIEVLLEKIGLRNGMPAKEMDSGALSMLYEYDWPGNVRELQNVLERACVTTDDDVLGPDQVASLLPNLDTRPRSAAVRRTRESNTLAERIADLERAAILDALEKSSGKKALAARMLGISRSTFYKKLEEHNLS